MKEEDMGLDTSVPERKTNLCAFSKRFVKIGSWFLLYIKNSGKTKNQADLEEGKGGDKTSWGGRRGKKDREKGGGIV